MRSMKAADPPNGAITRRALIGAFCATVACGAKPGRALGAEAGEAAGLIAEVRANRRDHNLAGETSIRDVAQALRRNVLMGDFGRVLETLPPEAQRFWRD